MLGVILKRGKVLRFVGPQGVDKADAAERELGPFRCDRVSQNEVRLTVDIPIPDAPAGFGSNGHGDSRIIFGTFPSRA